MTPSDEDRMRDLARENTALRRALLALADGIEAKRDASIAADTALADAARRAAGAATPEEVEAIVAAAIGATAHLDDEAGRLFDEAEVDAGGVDDDGQDGRRPGDDPGTDSPGRSPS